ncbi:MAG: PAS domain S-box protein [Thermoanaerobaculia bacterium]|nr:PAS domain S-box protein [Thermoanaerobaculia bacterium]
MDNSDDSRRQQGAAAWAEEYDLLVDAVRDYALFLLGPDGTIRSWNSGAHRIFGHSLEEAVGQHFSLFYSPQDQKDRRPEEALDVAAREGRVEDEGWLTRKDGSEFLANAIITALYEDDGSLHGFAMVTRDLSERYTAEQRLRQSEEMFRLLVSSVRDYAIFMLDPDGNIMSWNEGAERIKGFTPEEVFGEHFSIFYTVEDIEKKTPWKLLEIADREGRVEQEGWRVRKDGTRFWADVVITAVRDEDGKLRGYAKVTRDVTDRKRAEEMQQALLKQREARLKEEERRRLAEASSEAAQEANRAKDEFLMMLSHELRTPLSSILGWSRLLQTFETEDESLREGLDSIARSAELQASLIDDVLDISRIVTGKLRLEREPVDAAEAIREAAEQIRERLDAKSLRFETDIPTGVGIVDADRVRLEQIVWNLLSNAVKFTPEGGTVRLQAARRNGQVEIVVEDTGEGIDPALLPQIFETFTQGNMGVTRDHGGLGLGLTIVRHLIEAHDGTIEAESEGPGEGARFTVRIPLASETEQSRNATHPHHDQHLAGRLEGLSVLVVDDDLETRKLLSSTLRRTSATVESVPSVAEALAICAKEMPDLILSDISMPDVDGYDFLRMVREAENVRTPVIAISAFDHPPGSGNMAEFDDFLRKPIDPFELVDRIEDVVEGTAPEERGARD